MSFDMDQLAGSGESDDAQPDSQQSKSLIGNVYSNRGVQDPDSYKELDDWDVSDDDIALAYDVTAGSGSNSSLVRDALKRLSSSGSHEEWYTEMQVALAHRIAGLLGREELPDGRETRGAVPVMEQVSIKGEDIMDYLQAHPEFIAELDTEKLAELKETIDERAEPAEADD